MTKFKGLILSGGLFQFSTKGQANILKDFMTFTKCAGFRGRFEFNYVDDKNYFEDDMTIKQYLFRDMTNDLSKFDLNQALEQRSSSHLNEFLFKRYDLDDSIKQVDHATAKLFSILKSFLATGQKVLFLNMESIHFAPGLNERLARIIKREIELKNRTIIVHGELPKQWQPFLKGSFVQLKNKSFEFVQRVTEQEQEVQSFQELESNKHAA